MAFVGNRGIHGLSCNLWVIVALLILSDLRDIIKEKLGSEHCGRRESKAIRER